jgi:hypothetical protein
MDWMAAVPSWIWRSAGYGVVWFELLFWLLYVWRRTRVPALLAGILMHVGIALVYPIPVFGWIMVSIYAGLLPEGWYRPIEKSIRASARNVVPLSPRMITGIATAYALSVAAVYAPGYLPVKAVRKIAWLTAGIVPHEVFAENAFSRYDYQLLRLVGRWLVADAILRVDLHLQNAGRSMETSCPGIINGS